MSCSIESVSLKWQLLLSFHNKKGIVEGGRGKLAALIWIKRSQFNRTPLASCHCKSQSKSKCKNQSIILKSCLPWFQCLWVRKGVVERPSRVFHSSRPPGCSPPIQVSSSLGQQQRPSRAQPRPQPLEAQPLCCQIEPECHPRKEGRIAVEPLTYYFCLADKNTARPILYRKRAQQGLPWDPEKEVMLINKL